MNLALSSRLDQSVTDPQPISRAFRRDDHAPQAARNFVVAVLATESIDDDIAEVARLLTSELVTNAATHADRGQIHVAVHFEDKQVRVVVTDASRARAALPSTAPHPDEEHGRGWPIIEALAVDCGIERIGGGNGHRAWFALGISGGA